MKIFALLSQWTDEQVPDLVGLYTTETQLAKVVVDLLVDAIGSYDETRDSEIRSWIKLCKNAYHEADVACQAVAWLNDEMGDDVRYAIDSKEVAL